MLQTMYDWEGELVVYCVDWVSAAVQEVEEGIHLSAQGLVWDCEVRNYFLLEDNYIHYLQCTKILIYLSVNTCNVFCVREGMN